jgi:hypothetical protein
MYRLGIALFVLALSLVSNAQSPDEVRGSCLDADGSVRSGCFLLQAFGNYLPVPTRFTVSWEPEGRCTVLAAPPPPFSEPFTSAEYKKRLLTQGGMMRLCDRLIFDDELRAIEKTQGRGVSRTDRGILIREWRDESGEIRSTTTYFLSAKEGLMVSDSDPEFASRVWSEAKRLVWK